MNCAEVTKKISAYMDGELDAAESRFVSDHIAVCEACRREFEALTGVDGLVNALPKIDLPEGFASSVALKARMPRPVEEAHPQGISARLLQFFEAFFDLLGLDVSPATRALDEFNDVPSSFIGYAYFKVY